VVQQLHGWPSARYALGQTTVPADGSWRLLVKRLRSRAFAHLGLATLAILALGGHAPTARALPDDLPGPAGLLPDAGDLPVTTPDAVAAARYAAAARLSDAQKGAALLVIDGAALVFEHYAQGFDPARAHHLWSGTKTFACALVAAAADDGRFDFDTPLGAHWPELDPARGAVTVRQLLSLTSGFGDSPSILTADVLKARPRVADKEAWTIKHIRAEQPPGERYLYAASPFVFLASMARRALGEDPLNYLDRRVLGPIGMPHAGWLRDGAGLPWLALGAYTTARGWARFGMLLRDDGVFRGTRVLGAGRLAECFKGTARMPAYGQGLWLNAPTPRANWIPKVLRGRFAARGPVLWPDGPQDLVAAVGFRDNRLYVIPSRGLVVVRLGYGHPDFNDAALLRAVLGP
jgi:CubicO group peptidase (beta-lactamase class C family)